jgi:hypothetical protein
MLLMGRRMSKIQSFSLSMCSALLIVTAACGKKDEGGTGAAKTAGGGDQAAPAGKASPKVWKKIDKLGIEVEVGSDADIQVSADMPDTPSATIYSMDGSAPTTFVFGAKNPEEAITMAKDYDATKAKVQHEMDGFKSFTKDEKTADGFWLEYTGTDMIEKTKPLYGITIRSKLGAFTLECTTNADSEAQRAAAATLCKSIRAAK